MNTDPMQDEFEAITQDAANAAAASDLVPTGTYEGVLLDYTARNVDFEDSPFFGHKMVRAHVELYDCPKESGKTRHYYFNMSPTQATNDSGMIRSESKLAAQLAKHTGMVGQPFNRALDLAKETRLRYRVRAADGKSGFEPRNWTDAISAARK